MMDFFRRLFRRTYSDKLGKAYGFRLRHRKESEYQYLVSLLAAKMGCSYLMAVCMLQASGKDYFELLEMDWP